MEAPNSIYLILAKDEETAAALRKEGAIPISSDVFLSNESPQDPQRYLREGGTVHLETVVVDIFAPNRPNDIHGDHPETAQLKSLLSELHGIAFRWSKEHGGSQ